MIQCTVVDMKTKTAKKKPEYVDDLGRKWPTDMGDLKPGDSLWLGHTVKIISFDPKKGLTSALYEWTSDDGTVKRHLGLPPLKVGHAYHAEQEEPK